MPRALVVPLLVLLSRWTFITCWVLVLVTPGAWAKALLQLLAGADWRWGMPRSGWLLASLLLLAALGPIHFPGASRSGGLPASPSLCKWLISFSCMFAFTSETFSFHNFQFLYFELWPFLLREVYETFLVKSLWWCLTLLAFDFPYSSVPLLQI